MSIPVRISLPFEGGGHSISTVHRFSAICDTRQWHARRLSTWSMIAALCLTIPNVLYGQLTSRQCVLIVNELGYDGKPHRSLTVLNRTINLVQIFVSRNVVF